MKATIYVASVFALSLAAAPALRAQSGSESQVERGCPARDGALEMRKARSGQGVNRRSLGYFATLESVVDSDFRDQLRMFLIA